MKKPLKLAAVLTLAGVMAAFTACADVDTTPAAQPETTIPMVEVTNQMFEAPPIMPNFTTQSGTIREILPYYAQVGEDIVQVEDMSYIIMDTEIGSVKFLIDLTTAVMTDDLAEGMDVTAFYAPTLHMALIYPPQHRAVAIVQDLEHHALIERFDEDFQSFCGTHTLDIQDGTPIVHQDGTAFEGEIDELVNRKLFVAFEEEGTTIVPKHITVLFEVAVHPIHTLTDDELANLNLAGDTNLGSGALLLDPADVAMMWGNMLDPLTVQLTVNDQLLEDAPRPFADPVAGTIMIPLVPVVEALGYTAVVDGNEVIITPGTIVTEGVNSFARGREMARTLSAAPVMVDDVLFVPWDFFQEILDSPAFIDYGNVYVVSQ